MAFLWVRFSGQWRICGLVLPVSSGSVHEICWSVAYLWVRFAGQWRICGRDLLVSGVFVGEFCQSVAVLWVRFSCQQRFYGCDLLVRGVSVGEFMRKKNTFCCLQPSTDSMIKVMHSSGNASINC